MPSEIPIRFACEGDWLYGVLHLVQAPARRGVLVVVGGPQYRVGSHRQFVLLARALAQTGVPVMRFDYRGIGDSDGDTRTFEQVGGDIRSAVDTFLASVPGLSEVVIWGLCDAASAALFYAPDDSRVTGIVLLNPWIRTEAGIARAYLKGYYFARLTDPNLWRKIGRGEFSFTAALRSFISMVRAGLGVSAAAASPEAGASCARNALKPGDTRPLPERMREGMRRFNGHVLLILSGDDLTAAEFQQVVQASRQWRALLRATRVTRHDLLEASHTFSRAVWRKQVERWTQEWLRAW
jgi:exosortase A-associated hydrolase 1